MTMINVVKCCALTSHLETLRSTAVHSFRCKSIRWSKGGYRHRISSTAAPNLCTQRLSVERSSHAPDAAVEKYLHELKQGSRAALASAITLVETEHKVKKQLAKKLLTRILQEETDNNVLTPAKQKQSLRIGLSGPPGAGKSSFIEVFGKFLTERGHKVAVLAVDPSSAMTGGSLLGDKTRMVELTRDRNAFIRPSPARGHLGGVTRSTNEAIVICEYAGYDIILIETIGVGQSEYAVTNMVDLFVLLLPPGGGDELQGIKRGIIERADIILVTKADGDLLPAAHRTQYEYMAALKFMRSSTPKWKTKVQQTSSKSKEGIDKFWNLVTEFRKVTADNFQAKRSSQRNTWMWTHIREGLFNILLQDSQLKKTIEDLSVQVEEGKLAPGVASDEFLSLVTSNLKSNDATMRTTKSTSQSQSSTN